MTKIIVERVHRIYVFSSSGKIYLRKIVTHTHTHTPPPPHTHKHTHTHTTNINSNKLDK